MHMYCLFIQYTKCIHSGVRWTEKESYTFTSMNTLPVCTSHSWHCMLRVHYMALSYVRPIHLPSKWECETLTLDCSVMTKNTHVQVCIDCDWHEAVQGSASGHRLLVGVWLSRASTHITFMLLSLSLTSPPFYSYRLHLISASFITLSFSDSHH